MLRQRKQVARVSVVLCLLLLRPSVGRASIFGEENVILGSILAEKVRNTAQFGAMLENIRTSIRFARDGARLVRDAVVVANNVALIAKDPVGYMKANAQQFINSFPEGEGFTNELRAVRGTLRNAGRPKDYNPYAFAHLLESAQRTGASAYAVAVRAVETWGVTEEHDELLKELNEKRATASALAEDIKKKSKMGQMTPQAAAIYTATTSAIEAEAGVASAMMLGEILRIEKIRFMNDVQSANAQRAMETTKRKSIMSETESWALPVGPGKARRRR